MLKTLYIYRLSVVAILLIAPCSLHSQEHHHYLGVRGGYGLPTASFDPFLGEVFSVGGIDFGLAYKLYAEKNMGTQAEVNIVQTGYQLVDTTYMGRAVEVPLMAQGFIRFGGFRVFINAGVYGSYITKQTIEKPDESGNFKTETYHFADRDKRFDYGILGGGGFAFQLKKVELQLEARYQYGFGYIMKPRYNNEQVQLSNRSRLAFSLALFYSL